MSHVVVVGGAGGVGSVVTDLLFERGRQVAVTVLNQTEADLVGSRYGGRISAEIVDLSDGESARKKMNVLAEAYPDTDAVIVCAAIAPAGPAETTALSTYLKAYQVNCIGAVAVYQAFMPTLRRNSGRLIFLGSMGGRVALPFLAPYVATKFALEGLCDVMRREAAPQGVKVSLIQPGGIRTNLVYQQLLDVKRDYEALDTVSKENYGYLYRGFSNFASASLSSTASAPGQIASVVVEALEADRPASRYVAGDDARQLLNMAAVMSDKEMDDFLSTLFLEDVEASSDAE